MMLLDLLQRRLRVKVIALVAAILIVGFGLLMIVNIRREAQVLVDANQETDRKSTRLNSSHSRASRMPSSA